MAYKQGRQSTKMIGREERRLKDRKTKNKRNAVITKLDFDIKSVEPSNWPRLAESISAMTDVLPVKTPETGTILTVEVSMSVPANKHEALLNKLRSKIDETIKHRATHPQRHPSQNQIVVMS